MTRHAQEYWLRLQADAALQVANSVELDAAFFQEVQSRTMLHMLRQQALHEAAMHLAVAELLHREIVGRGGQGEAKESVD